MPAIKENVGKLDFYLIFEYLTVIEIIDKFKQPRI